MRYAIALAALLTAAAAPSLAPTPAHADPYPWCAQYGSGAGGGENCYMRTFAECRAAVSGVGGFCRRNGFFDGRPVITQEDRIPRRYR